MQIIMLQSDQCLNQFDDIKSKIFNFEQLND